MSSKDVVWRQMWGAKVQWPCDMADDLLEDCITVTVSKLEQMEEDQEELQAAGVRISQVRPRVTQMNRLLFGSSPSHARGNGIRGYRFVVPLSSSSLRVLVCVCVCGR